MTSNSAHDHYIQKKKVYKQLSRHPYILRYHSKAKVVSAEQAIIRLLLQYYPAGTLATMLFYQQFPNSVDKTK
jgi:hypothetical protein